MRLGPADSGDGPSLERWLADGYAPAFCTACLILHNRADAEEAVQEAFLRAWRFRAAVPDEAGVRPWLYRVVVNACISKLRSEAPRQARSTPRGGAGVVPHPARRSGWAKAWDHARRTFNHGLESVVSASGGIAVFVLCLAAAALVLRLLWALVRRRLV
jgi:DNA-directed RNA polymerase specialized sigma24 family protein